MLEPVALLLEHETIRSAVIWLNVCLAVFTCCWSNGSLCLCGSHLVVLQCSLVLVGQMAVFVYVAAILLSCSVHLFLLVKWQSVFKWQPSCFLE